MSTQASSTRVPAAFKAYAEKHPQPKQLVHHFNYPVSGVRSLGEQLDFVAFRTGLLAALRSQEWAGCAIGLMVTASHNPAKDNGIKLIDKTGSMLTHEWVQLASELLSLPDERVADWLQKQLSIRRRADGGCFSSCDAPLSLVFIGYDTRISSPKLALSAEHGVLALGGRVHNFGLLTTPQLSFIIQEFNIAPDKLLDCGKCVKPGEEHYYEQLASSFELLCQLDKQKQFKNYVPILYLDCANGVGYPKMKILADRIKPWLNIHFANIGDSELNYECGADFVKINQKAPNGVKFQSGCRYATFDGDADRIIYFFAQPDTEQFVLLDGDKISLLAAAFIQRLLKKADLNKQLELVVVQTAYANGSSTRYLEEQLGVRAPCVQTGVLHLLEKAAESDIGIYFEANGHGSVLFSEKAKTNIAAVADMQIRQELQWLLKLINQATGDAISDLLLVEVILRRLDWSELDWSSMYQDLPQRQLKVCVKDRSIFVTTPDARSCIQPIGLQEHIDKLVEKYGSSSRSFVRSSQTEDIVRVYAESDTQQNADSLAAEVEQLVNKFSAC